MISVVTLCHHLLTKLNDLKVFRCGKVLNKWPHSHFFEKKAHSFTFIRFPFKI